MRQKKRMLTGKQKNGKTGNDITITTPWSVRPSKSCCSKKKEKVPGCMETIEAEKMKIARRSESLQVREKKNQKKKTDKKSNSQHRGIRGV
jgi:hypothetical protein